MLARGVSRDVGLGLRMVAVLVALLVVYLAVAALALLLGRERPVYLALLLLLPALELYAGGRSVLARAGARDPDPAEAAYFGGILDRLAGLADISTPKLAVIDSPIPSGFALGRRTESAVVVVTTGLRSVLDDGEVEAVLAHEIAHVANKDAAVMTLASPLSVLGGRLFYTPIWPVAALIFGLGTLITITLSRYREYVADHGAALLTGEPEQLMSALVKISDEMRISTTDLRESYALSAFLIVPPQGRQFELFMDHPPLETRLAKLGALSRELGKGA